MPALPRSVVLVLSSFLNFCSPFHPCCSHFMVLTTKGSSHQVEYFLLYMSLVNHVFIHMLLCLCHKLEKKVSDTDYRI